LKVRSAHELIPSTNSVDAHLQDTAVNDELLLNILQALAERPGSLHATRNSGLFQSVGKQPVAPTSSSTVVPPPARRSPTPPAKLTFLSMFCMYIRQDERTQMCSKSKSPVWERSTTTTTTTPTTTFRSGSECQQPCRLIKYLQTQISESGLF
jgi:hypothetical protein